MRINHNIAALNTYRQLGAAQTGQANSMQKLSSGLRINSAKDDAAGLAISEKMRSQVRGLDQASANAQDGISLIQTAEGALNETHDILQRMRELATQSANDTNTTDDRKEIQKEMNQLTSEINRIGNNTEFNTQKLLNGNKAGSAQEAGPVSELKSATNFGTLKIESKLTGKAGDVQSVEFIKGEANSSLSVDYTNNKLTITLAADADGNLDGTKNTNTLIKSAIEADSGVGGANEAFTVTAGTGTDVQSTLASKTLAGGRDSGTLEAKDGKATLQIGANQNQSFTIEINDMRGSALGISGTAEGSVNGVASAAYAKVADTDALTDKSVTAGDEYALDVTDSTKASAAITVIDNAIAKVSGERSKLGAYQNRLDHTINNLSTSSENLTAAESRIRDVDYALAA